jgi:hypothetical protein
MLSSAALATIGMLAGLDIAYLGPEEKEGCKWYSVEDKTDRYHLKRCFDASSNGVFKVPRAARGQDKPFEGCVAKADVGCLESGITKP